MTTLGPRARRTFGQPARVRPTTMSDRPALLGFRNAIRRSRGRHMSARAHAPPRADVAHRGERRRAQIHRHRIARSTRTHAVVKVFWDVDNCAPRVDGETVMAHRVMRAARAFGAIDGDVMAYANAETLGRLTRGVIAGGEVCGVTCVRCEGGADAADAALAEDALAWASTVATAGVAEAAPVFSTKRQRALREVSAEEEAAARAEAVRWAGRAAEAAEALPTVGGGSTVDAIVRGREHVMMLVTSDNDVKLVMDYARARGVCVVVLANLSPNAASGGMKIKTKRLRNVAKSIGSVGMNNAYFEAVKLEGERRQLSRLKLLQSADGALLWDPNRRFAIREDERVDASGEEPVAGDVVGVWRPDKGGIGRWYA